MWQGPYPGVEPGLTVSVTAHRPVGRQEGAPGAAVHEDDVLVLGGVHHACLEHPSKGAPVIAQVLMGHVDRVWGQLRQGHLFFLDAFALQSTGRLKVKTLHHVCCGAAEVGAPAFPECLLLAGHRVSRSASAAGALALEQLERQNLRFLVALSLQGTG